MKKSAGFLVVAFLLVLSVSASAMAGQVLDRIIKKGELTVGMSTDFPPLHVKDKDGQIIGLDADLAKAIAMAMGVKPKIVTMRFYDLLPALQAGKVDMVISGMTITPERNLKVAFVGPYFISGQAILAKHETVLKLNQKKDVESLEFNLAVPKGSTSEAIAKAILPRASIIVTETMGQGLDMVITGKADALMADKPYCVVASFRNKDKNLEVSETFTYEPLGIALSGDDSHLINWMENFLMAIQGNGTLEKLTKFWFTDPVWMQHLAN